MARQGELIFEDNYLVLIGEDVFWQPAWSMSIQFMRDEAGRVVAAERQDGTRWPKAEEAD